MTELLGSDAGPICICNSRGFKADLLSSERQSYMFTCPPSRDWTISITVRGDLLTY